MSLNSLKEIANQIFIMIRADLREKLENMFVGCVTIPGTAAWLVFKMGAKFLRAILLFFCKHALCFVLLGFALIVRDAVFVQKL